MGCFVYLVPSFKNTHKQMVVFIFGGGRGVWGMRCSPACPTRIATTSPLPNPEIQKHNLFEIKTNAKKYTGLVLVGLGYSEGYERGGWLNYASMITNLTTLHFVIVTPPVQARLTI